MNISIQKMLLNNSSLKISAGIIGFLSWTIASELRYYFTTIEVPLAFYNTSANQQINAPENVTITLAARRTEMRPLRQETIAVHIDTRTLKQGINRIDISHKNLLLPRTINLINYKPIQVTLT